MLYIPVLIYSNSGRQRVKKIDDAVYPEEHPTAIDNYRFVQHNERTAETTKSGLSSRVE